MHTAGDTNHLIAFHNVALIAAQQAGVKHHAKAQLIGIAVNDKKANRFAVVRHPDEAMQFAISNLLDRNMHLAVGGQRNRLRLGQARRLRSHQIPP